MPPQYDVIIAGAGPGGCGAAARLLQQGRPAERILVLERYRFPRPKPCGGGLTGHVDPAMAELGLRLEVPHVASHSAWVRYGSFDRTITLEKPVNVIRREDYDESLMLQIRARGVEVIEGEGVRNYDSGADQVTVRTSAGRELSASVLIGADGAASVVRKQLLDNEKALPHRLFKLEMALPAARAMDPRMLYDFTPMLYGLRGYLWIFPVPGGLINVGVMHYPAFRQSGTVLLDILRRGLAEHEIELPDSGSRGWPAWGYQPRKTVAQPRVLTIGDAAGIDGLTGEGIAVALEHAIVAGDAVAAAFASGDFSFAGYRRQLRRATVGRELALDRWLARLLYRSRTWRSWMSLVLFDDDVLNMYAARVAGSQVLADQKLRLYGALLRHALRHRARRQALARAGQSYSAVAALPPAGEG